jgi:5-methylcytosine-specific restriction endonuclease McrA
VVGVDEKIKAEGQCRLCERTNRKLTRHRIVPGRRPWRGIYVWQNVVPLCWPCHAAVEDDVNARRMLRARLWPVEVAYATRRMWGAFDELYPVPAAHARATRPILAGSSPGL